MGEEGQRPKPRRTTTVLRYVATEPADTRTVVHLGVYISGHMTSRTDAVSRYTCTYVRMNTLRLLFVYTWPFVAPYKRVEYLSRTFSYATAVPVFVHDVPGTKRRRQQKRRPRRKKEEQEKVS